MTDQLQDTVFALFLLFCRIGTCLMVLPGFSSAQIPARIRLFLALGVTLALAPALSPGMQEIISRELPSGQIELILAEVAVGLLIGLMGRMFYLALEFICAAVTTFIGYGAIPGTPIVDTEPASPLSSMITVTATLLIFVSDLHLEVIRALHATYDVINVKTLFDTGSALKQVTIAATKSFSAALQIGGPFLVYSIVANLLFSLANKLTPQIPVYFISVPFIIVGGLGILLIAIPEFVWIFMQAFERWLQGGR